MKREEAVEVLKQILQGSSITDYKSLTLLLHPNNNLSKGYQIRVDPGDSEFIESLVRKIATDSGLAVARKEKALIVYRPI